MKKLLGLLFLISTVAYSAVVYYGDGAAVFLENLLQFEKSGTVLDASGDKLLYTDTNGVQKALGVNQNYSELMEDPSFESITDEGTCVNCAATLVPAITLTGENRQRLSLVFSAAGTYTVDKTTGDGFFGLPSNVECEVSTTNSDIDFAHRSNGANVATVDVDAVAIASGAGATTEVTRALRSNVIGTTSEGFQIIAGSAGTVFLDNCTISTKQVLSSVGADSNAKEYTPTIGLTGGTTSVLEGRYWRKGQFLYGEIKVEWSSIFTGGVSTFSLPDGLLINTGLLPNGGNTETDIVGDAWLEDNSAASNISPYLAKVQFETTSSVRVSYIFNTNNNSYPIISNNILTTLPFTWANGDSITLNYKVPIQGWTASFDALSDSNQNETVTKILSANVSTSGTTLTDLTFSDLVIGAEYEITLNALHGGGAAVISEIGIIHNGTEIGKSQRYAGGSSAQGIQSVTVKFIASASTLTFLTGFTGFGFVQGNGTQSETFAQLRRIDNQINAILKDVVTSPGSSNGKPVIYSFYVTDGTGTTTISREVGDLSTGVCTNASAGIYACPIRSDLPIINCFCDVDVLSDSTCVAVEASGTIDIEINSSGVKTDRNFKIFCHGVLP